MSEHTTHQVDRPTQFRHDDEPLAVPLCEGLMNPLRGHLAGPPAPAPTSKSD